MIPFLIMAVVLWGVGAVTHAPKRARWAMIGILYVAVILALAVLPDAHPMRTTLGGSLGEWLLLGGFAAVIMAYRFGLRALRSRVAPVADSEAEGTFRPAELDRYMRHILLREIGGPGQKKLKEAKVLVVGAGGLGAPAGR